MAVKREKKLEQAVINILLVDDDEVDIQSVQRALKKCTLPIKLRIARNGLEALQLLYGESQYTPTQIIILDINMPKMNGVEFLQELHSQGGYDSTKIVVLTTSKYDKFKINATSVNVDKYLLKPVKIKDLVEACKPLL